ncbi:MAG: thioredoxin-disulfide reductase [Candidatus Heimdallarchaeota archaeon]
METNGIVKDLSQKIIIIGSGPAGLTAAIYSARAGLNPLIIAGFQAGGQLMLTTTVENYPGFPNGIDGPELIKLMRIQAERYGAKFIDEDVKSVDFTSRPFKVTSSEETYEGKAIIIATGASTRWLGLESEQRLIGRGVSSCATCDGFFFKNKEVVVVGGGDGAMEEALYLANLASKVTVIHRRDQLRASKIMQERAFKNSKIHFIWNSIVTEIIGENRVEGVILNNVNTREATKLKCDGIFIAIGQEPNTKLFEGQIELDEKGYIVTDGTRTNIEGVFCAGDVFDYRYRQAITAAGSGCEAAIDAERWLSEQE